MGRAARLALIFSLVLNAFLIAFAATLVWTAHERAGASAAQALRRTALSLDTAHRPAFVAAMRQRGRESRQLNLEARGLRRDVWAAFQAPRFDPAAAKARLAQARDLNQTARERVENGLIDIAAALPADQRAALGRALERLTPRPKTTAPATSPASPGQGPSAGRRSPP